MLSLLDTIFPGAIAATPDAGPQDAQPQTQVPQQPIDDLALRGEIARRLREAFDRGVTAQQPGERAAQWNAAVVQNPVKPVQDRLLPSAQPAPQLPQAQDSTSAFVGAAVPPGANVTMGRLAQDSEAPQEPAQPQRTASAPMQPVTALQAPQATPAALARLQSAEPSGMDRFAAFFAGTGDQSKGALSRIASGFLAQDQLGQTRLAQNSTYNALTKAGMPSDVAVAATLNAGNPAVAALITQTLSPKTQVVNNQLIDSRSGKVIADFRDSSAKMQTANFKDENGNEITYALDPLNQRWVAPDGRVFSPSQNVMQGAPGATQPQPMPMQQQGGGAQFQPVAAPQPTLGTNGQPQMPVMVQGGLGVGSPYAIPQTPQGANAKAFREEMSKKTADEMKDDREKAIGAVEFLQQSQQARDLINQKGHVIGRFAEPTAEHGPNGLSWTDVLLNPTELAARTAKGYRDLFGSGGDSNEPGTLAADNAARDELKQSLTKLAQSGLKATYGARVTNIDVQQQAKTVPHLTDQDAKTSLNKLDTVEQTSWRNLDRGIQSGVIDPKSIDPDVLVRGVQSGQLHLPAALADAVKQYAASRGR